MDNTAASGFGGSSFGAPYNSFLTSPFISKHLERNAQKPRNGIYILPLSCLEPWPKTEPGSQSRATNLWLPPLRHQEQFSRSYEDDEPFHQGGRYSSHSNLEEPKSQWRDFSGHNDDIEGPETSPSSLSEHVYKDFLDLDEVSDEQRGYAETVYGVEDLGEVEDEHLKRDYARAASTAYDMGELDGSSDDDGETVRPGDDDGDENWEDEEDVEEQIHNQARACFSSRSHDEVPDDVQDGNQDGEDDSDNDSDDETYSESANEVDEVCLGPIHPIHKASKFSSSADPASSAHYQTLAATNSDLLSMKKQFASGKSSLLKKEANLQAFFRRESLNLEIEAQELRDLKFEIQRQEQRLRSMYSRHGWE